MKLKYRRFRDKAHSLLLEKGPMAPSEMVHLIQPMLKNQTPTPMQAGCVLVKDPRFIKHSTVKGYGYGGLTQVWEAVENG